VATVSVVDVVVAVVSVVVVVTSAAAGTAIERAATTTARTPARIPGALPLAPVANPLGDHAVHLEHLGVLAVHVDAMRARDVPDVLGVRVPAMLLRRVLRERGGLALDVLLLEREVALVREVEVVPGDLVAKDRRALERAK